MPLNRRMIIQSAGVTQGAASILNFTGTVAATVSGGVGTINGTGGAGSTVSGQVEIDFGAFPGVPEASIAVASASIVAGSRITLSLAAVATADRTVEDVILEELDLLPSAPNPGVGFTIYARSRQQFVIDASNRRGALNSVVGNALLWGKFLINWSYT